MSYRKKLNLIVESYLRPGDIIYTDTIIRAIAELHRIEMSLHNLMKELPEFNIQPENTREPKHCDCIKTGTMTHFQCRCCKQVWCPTTLKQDWCPNPDCSHGIKGNTFRPYDEHFQWVQCSNCEMWFKTSDILAVHHCYIRVNPKAIEGYDNEEPIVHQDQVMPKRTEPTIEIEPIVNSSPIEEHIEEEQETEAERYWRKHPVRRRVI